MKRGVVWSVAFCLAAWANGCVGATIDRRRGQARRRSPTCRASTPTSTAPAPSSPTQMAIDDFGGTVLGKKIELVQADIQNKADVAASHRRALVRQREGRRDPGRRRVVVVDRHLGRRRREEADLPRAPIPPRPTSPASSATPTPCTGSTTPSRSPTAPARRSSRRAARAGSSSPPTTPSATRCERDVAAVVTQGRRQGAGRGPASDQHAGLLVLPAAGAGLQGAGHRPRQCRRRHHQLDQAGGRVRHRQGRPEARRPAGLRLRRALARRWSARRA